MTIPPHSLSAIRQPAFMLDASGRVAAANDLAEVLAGRPLAGVSATETAALVFCRRQDGSPLARAELPSSRALRGEEVIEEPLLVTAPGGRTLNILATASPIREADAIIGALVLWQDVTEREQNRAALEESERRHAFLLALGDRLRALDDVSAITGVAVEMLGRHLDANGVAYCRVDAAGATVQADWTDGTVPSAAGRHLVDDAGDRSGLSDVRVGPASLRVPVLRGGRLSAVVSVRSKEPRIWTDSEIELVRQAADRVSASAGRARAEEALRLSEERLRLAQESAQIGTWDRDIATDTVTISREFLLRYGLEGIALSCYADLVQLIHPDDRSLVAARRAAALASGEPMNLELRVRVPSGEYRWVQFRGRGVLNDRGVLVRVIGILIDVTDRRLAEEARAESEADARSFFQNMIDACTVLETVSDEDGHPVDARVLAVNPALERELSLPAGSLVGRTAFTILPELPREWFDLYVALTRHRTFVDVEEPFPALGRWYHITSFPVRRGRVAVVFRNITERRRIEDALRESEERLRDVLELSLDAVYRTDLVAGRFDYISPINEALTGFSAEEFGAFGLDEFLDRIHVEDQPRVKMVVAEAMRGGCNGTSGTIEYRFRHRDGSWRWLSDHFTLQADGEGRPRYRVGVVRDVTRRRRIEVELWESEERLRLAQEGARIGIWDWEAATNRVTISPDFLAIYGLEALAISCYADLERMIHPEDRMQVWDAQLAVLASGARMELELRIVLPPGEIRWVQFKGQAIMDGQGALARVIGVLIDVTERKRAEKAMVESEADARSFFENMVDACAICETVCNEHGEPVDIRLVDVNPAFARALAMPAELIVNQTAFMILPALAREWFDLFLQVSQERTFIEVEEPFPALDRWYHVTAFPARHDRVAVVFRDITERREAEADRARFTEELQRSNEDLQRFAYIASHDLQEPLRSIVSFSQLLERRYRGQLGQDADEFIGFIVEGGMRMQRLIEDLLQVSRIETQAEPLEPTDVGEVVEGVLRAIETPIREAGATVEVGPMPTVMADAAQLSQVVTNLVGNALKYRRPDVPALVRISAERVGRVWRFAVQDNGIGIEAEYFGRIFVIFQRLHTKDEYEGTGIGLAVVRKIVERHGGRVWVESVPGEGSTFFFTLPAAGTGTTGIR